MAVPRLPLLPVACAALVLGLLLPPEPWVAWLVPGALLLAAAAGWARGAALGLALGVLLGADDAVRAGPWPEHPARVVRVEGVVLRADPGSGGGSLFVLQAQSVGEGAQRRACDARIEVRTDGAAGLELRPGDRLGVTLRLAGPAGPRNPGEQDRRDWARRRGIDAQGWASGRASLTRLERSTSLAGELHGLRAGAARLLSERLPARDAGLARGLLLGDRGAVTREDARIFRESGQSHLVAVSGQHVALVLAGVLLLARALGAGARGSALVGLLAVLLYVPLAGAAPSAVRSGLGASLWLLARLFARRGRSLELLAATALTMLVAVPADLGDPGFTLSFSAVLGIELLAPRLLAGMARPMARVPGLLEPRPPRLRQALAVALAAWLAGAPLALHAFGQLAPAATPLSLLCVPLAALLLGLTALVLLLGGLPGLGPLLSAGTTLASDALREVLRWPDHVGLGALEARRPGDLWLALTSGMLLLAALGPPRLLRWALLAVAALLLGALEPTRQTAPPWPTALWLDAGRAPAVLLRLPDGRAALLGAGSDAQGDPAGQVVRPALHVHGVQHLDLAWCAEPDGPCREALERVLTGVPAARVHCAGAGSRVLLGGAWGRVEERLEAGRWTVWLVTRRYAVPLLPAPEARTGRGARETAFTPAGPVARLLQFGPGKPATQGYDPTGMPVTPPPEPLHLLLFALGLALFAVLSVRPLGWLAVGGAAGAFALGLLSTAALGWAAFGALLAPFVVATLLGRLPGRPKEGGRSLRQVLANGLPAVLGALLALLGAREEGAALLVGGLACLGADTCATEIGTRFGGAPRALLGGRVLTAGESGGVTRLGLVASLGGAALAPLAYAALAGTDARLTALLTAAGFAAALLDSLLGATLQFRGRDPQSGATTERTRLAGRPLERVSGLRWLDNDAVNLVSGLAGGLLAVALARWA